MLMILVQCKWKILKSGYMLDLDIQAQNTKKFETPQHFPFDVKISCLRKFIM